METASFKATLGGRKPLLVLSSSRMEFELIVFGLFPILTWAVTEIVKQQHDETCQKLDWLFHETDGFVNKVFPLLF